MNTKKLRHPAIDSLRVVAILAVLAIHITTRTIEASGGDITSEPFSFLVNQLARFAVPLFFMISGYVLELNYPNHENYGMYLKKRFNKILIPYIFWSIFYYVAIYPTHTFSIFEALIGGNASYQLYFIPTLLIFYLIFPFLHKIYNVLSNKLILSSLVLLQIALLARDYYIHPLPLFYPVDSALLNVAVFILGMVASHNQEALFNRINQFKYVLSAFLIGLAIFVWWEAKTLFLATHNYLDYYSSWRPSVFLYTIFVALLGYFCFEKTKRLEVISKKLSHLSFFVFFVHVSLLELFWNSVGHVLFLNMQTSALKTIFLICFFMSVATLSYALAFVAHRIPHLSKITG